MSHEAKCPFSAHAGSLAITGTQSNKDWWPNQLNLKMLHQHSSKSNPLQADFNYREAFKHLDLDAVIADLHALMTDSQ
ncbi:MAG: catalase-peroxidase, partial [Xanthomonadales bacterium]|nr:catalase-peroxidase [Xanthomonadales bacterium]